MAERVERVICADNSSHATETHHRSWRPIESPAWKCTGSTWTFVKDQPDRSESEIKGRSEISSTDEKVCCAEKSNEIELEEYRERTGGIIQGRPCRDGRKRERFQYRRI